MKNSLQCPGCNRRLLIDQDADDDWLTCPGCLGTFVNPLHETRFAAGAPRSVQPPLRLSLERDIRRDSQISVGVLLLLPVLFAIGLALYGNAVGRPGYVVGIFPDSFWALALVLAVVTAACVGIILWRATRHRPGVVTALAAAGGVIAFILGMYFIALLQDEGASGLVVALVPAMFLFLILGFISAAIVSHRRPELREEQKLGRVVLGTFALLGALGLTGIACFILFFLACLGTMVG